jgi:ABC-2 type transport system permease protein
MHGSVPAGEIGLVLVSSVLLVAVFGPITMVLYRNKK